MEVHKPLGNIHGKQVALPGPSQLVLCVCLDGIHQISSLSGHERLTQDQLF